MTLIYQVKKIRKHLPSLYRHTIIKIEDNRITKAGPSVRPKMMSLILIFTGGSVVVFIVIEDVLDARLKQHDDFNFMLKHY